MDKKIRQLLPELRAGLADLYGERLRGVYVFGSHARDEADRESDLDILIVLDRIDDYLREIARTGMAISELSLRYGVAISRVFASEEQWHDAATMFFLNVREEALPV